MLAKFSLLLVTKSLPYAFLILGIITSPIFSNPFPVAFTVLSSLTSDVLLVLLTVISVAAWESFLVNDIPSFTSGLRISTFSARYLFVGPGFAIFSLRDTFGGRPFYRQPSGHSLAVGARCVASYKQLVKLQNHILSCMANSGFNLFFYLLFVIIVGE